MNYFYIDYGMEKVEMESIIFYLRSSTVNCAVEQNLEMKFYYINQVDDKIAWTLGFYLFNKV